MCKVLQMSSMELVLSLYNACAIATFLGVSRDVAFGLPPFRPLALAA